MKRLKQVTVGLSIFIVLAAIGVVLYLIFLSNSSVKGTVKNTRTSPSASTADSASLLTLRGQYFTMQYPSFFSDQSSQLTDRLAIEQHVLTATAFNNKKLAITIIKLPTGDLSESSAYKLRTSSQSYSPPVPIAYASGTGSLIKSTDGQDQTVFITNNGLLATLSFTLNGSRESEDSDVATVIKSFNWNR